MCIILNDLETARRNLIHLKACKFVQLLDVILSYGGGGFGVGRSSVRGAHEMSKGFIVLELILKQTILFSLIRDNWAKTQSNIMAAKAIKFLQLSVAEVFIIRSFKCSEIPWIYQQPQNVSTRITLAEITNRMKRHNVINKCD
jgi:hypothetical protein